jgi:hypothetical protein
VEEDEAVIDVADVAAGPLAVPDVFAKALRSGR